MFCSFQTTTHGKWVLAGEHAVLRGHAALAFPIHEKALNLRYEPNNSDLSAEFEGPASEALHLLFWSVLEHGQHLRAQSLNKLTGHFNIHSNIPIGVGLGASAALCVALSRWFAAQKLISQTEVFSFATDLEDLFHGKSSGLDIAAVSSTHGIHFQNGSFRPVQPAWEPEWYLSSSGQVGMTSHCINQVSTFWQQNEEIAIKVDQRMQKSVEKSLDALKINHATSLKKLQEAIEEGAHCFSAWGLISNSLLHHMDILKKQGALAVKPTGSGGGGYVLSLWDKPPPVMAQKLIKL